MKRNIILGIDNGFGGAVALLDAVSGDLLDMHFMPTTKKALATKRKGKIVKRTIFDEKALSKLFRDLKKQYTIKHAYQEEAIAMPMQSAQSTATTFYGYGFIKGVLASLSIKTTVVRPATWSKIMLAGYTGVGKVPSIKSAKANAPLFDFTFGKSVEHDGATDAFLIGLYGINHLGKG